LWEAGIENKMNEKKNTKELYYTPKCSIEAWQSHRSRSTLKKMRCIKIGHVIMRMQRQRNLASKRSNPKPTIVGGLRGSGIDMGQLLDRNKHGRVTSFNII
jgi:hypothetical protein